MEVLMWVARLNVEDLRRAEAEAKREWERAALAVRVANEEVQKAHQKYLQAWKALAEATRPIGRPNQERALRAKAG